jgi:hypothetical protein
MVQGLRRASIGWCPSGVSLVEEAMQALAERGQWVSRVPHGQMELLRADLRKAARRRDIRIRTVIDRGGALVVATHDGFPAEEPWRGAAVHMHEVDPHASIRMAWLDPRFGYGDR